MTDATTAAKARIERALIALERKINDLKARPAAAPPVGDDDLFAARPGVAGGVDASRVTELEAAGREASAALAEAAEAVRDILDGRN